jgi:hypothetical protein
MKLIKGDIWKCYEINKDAFVGITTNGFIKNNGECVMGRGIALQSKNRWSDLPTIVGTHVKEKGNTVLFINKYRLFTFPVKHKWFEKADLELIEDSARTIADMFYEGYNLGADLPKLFMPKPGCGNGGLLWKDVEPVINPYLEPLVTIIDFNDDYGEPTR